VKTNLEILSGQALTAQRLPTWLVPGNSGFIDKRL
jgi:hypothetical protein